MITIKIQESEAFDRLSILEVKKIKSKGKPFVQQELAYQIEELQTQISQSIGKSLSQNIYYSKEYKNLFEINKRLFECVDKAKKNEITAKEVDDEVYNRHLAKKEIQQVFFGEDFSEIKIGYKNE